MSKKNRYRAETRRPDLRTPVARDTIKRRMTVVAFALALGMGLATGRAVMLQTVESAQLRREAARNYVRTETIDAWRGDIVDRSGAVLAISVNRWAVTVDPHYVDEPEKTAEVLAPILAMDAADILQRIDPATARPDDKDPRRNPTTVAARKIVSPMASHLARIFRVPRARFDRRLDILEKFFQLEHLQNPAVFSLVDLLADAAETSAAALRADIERLRFFPTQGRRFAYIANDLEDEKIRALTEARDLHAKRCRELRRQGRKCSNPLQAVSTQTEPRRYYPKRELGAQLLGLVGREGTGLSGIERAMDAILTGKQHRVAVIKDRRHRKIFLNGIPEDAPLQAPTVQLTIDQQLQAVAERELAKSCLSSGARAGYAIVMKVKTGEVLAAANFPTYNPNTFQDWFAERRPLKDERLALTQRRRDLAWLSQWGLTQKAFPDQHEVVANEERQALSQQIDAFVEYQHLFPNASRNAAFLDVYEPGSIIKVFTVAGALEDGLLDPSRTYDLENGDWELHDADDNVIHDVSRLREGDVAMIIKKSSNIGAAKIAFEMGADRLQHYLQAFGFGAPTHSGVPGEAKGLLRPAAQWVPVELANVSFGQGMAATGIQLVTAVSALGNRGRLMRPLLVKRLIDPHGNTIKDWKPEVVRQVVSDKTATTVLDLMLGVTEPDGTGKRAYIPGYPVAGKTGTGQKPHLRKRGYSEEMWVNTFFGVTPVNDPELAIVVLIDEPTGKRHGGGLIAAPTFKRIATWALPYLGIPSPYEAGKRQAWLDPTHLAERRALPDNAGDPLEAIAPPVDTARSGDVPMPDFRGMTMDRVREIGAELGLQLRLRGSGIAIAQDAAPHQRVDAGRLVQVTFQTRAPGLHHVDAPAGVERPQLPVDPTPSGEPEAARREAPTPDSEAADAPSADAAGRSAGDAAIGARQPAQGGPR